MAAEQFHDLFVASAGVAGALIGLLFVAISVARERLEAEDASQMHRIGAAAALTAFSNALTVSLFGLIPGSLIGGTGLVVGILGLLFVTASLISIARVRGSAAGIDRPRDVMFLVSLAAVFVLQVIEGLASNAHPDGVGHVRVLAILVVVCFLIGITRSWVLIGGPSIGLRGELGALVRERVGDGGGRGDGGPD